MNEENTGDCLSSCVLIYSVELVLVVAWFCCQSAEVPRILYKVVPGLDAITQP